MAAFETHTWQSRDGLALSARDYRGDPARSTVVCLPGLTRNARDFEDLAAAIAQPGGKFGGRRVICPDLRGRGLSAYSPDSATYNPAQYLDDTLLMLADLGVEPFVAIGTSLGGLLTLLLASVAPSRIAGAVLNDIGPDIDPAGLARIRGYVGVAQSYPDWDTAARALAGAQADIYPDAAPADWLRLARRMMREKAGAIVFDYDMAIAEPFAAADGTTPAPDLWPLFDTLAGRPLLVVRGGVSDILSRETADAMVARHQGAQLLTLPGIGHAPTLDEPVARDAIARLLGQVA
ncbi:alpha/beta fold hydrolase [Novosphingobium sp.]|uniref:alpha/beta fold hydrolase n=1 Tax=Novosphingobium sp. TaxID=1874826 RepID=UPI003D0E6758